MKLSIQNVKNEERTFQEVERPYSVTSWSHNLHIEYVNLILKNEMASQKYRAFQATKDKCAV